MEPITATRSMGASTERDGLPLVGVVNALFLALPFWAGVYALLS